MAMRLELVFLRDRLRVGRGAAAGQRYGLPAGCTMGAALKK